jgi:hypothetical protein
MVYAEIGWFSAHPALRTTSLLIDDDRRRAVDRAQLFSRLQLHLLGLARHRRLSRV